MSAARERHELESPRMRGWIHLVAFAVSVVAGAALVGVAAAVEGSEATWSTALYAIGLSALFGVSALYHRRRWTSTRSRAWMRRLDHATIFVFIACTYTVFSVLALPPDASGALLAVVWIGAAAGVALELARPVGRRWIRVPLYLALGWAVVPVIGEIGSHLGPAAVVLLAAGGIAYSIGAILYAAGWPNPWPRTFGHHELFHTATVVGATLHAVAVWLVVIG
jgi:hemolysin III